MTGTCLVGFLCGIPMCFDTGFLLFQIMDKRTGNAILLMALVELVCLSYFYGTAQFFENIKEMGMKIPLAMKWFWAISWNLTTPLIVVVVLIKTWVDFVPDHYLDYTYEAPVQFLGWLLELSPVGVVTIIGIYSVWKRRNEGLSTHFFHVGPMLKPKHTWGPRQDAEQGSPTEETGADNPGYDGEK